MTNPDCHEMQLLVQADIDGELAPAEAARVAAHLATCDACAAAQRDLLVLSQHVRAAATRHTAPEHLRTAVLAQIAAASGAASTASANENRPPTMAKPRRIATLASGVGLGIAASLALMFLRPASDLLSNQLVADHIRALQPGHLADVVSTDQHTVKPWFDGRLDYAPPVRDFASQGFPLTGGRLDYISNRPVAALVYARRKHIIDVYVWPAGAGDGFNARPGSHIGYNFVEWQQAGMIFWAVSDLNADELASFANLWLAKTGK